MEALSSAVFGSPLELNSLSSLDNVEVLRIGVGIVGNMVSMILFSVPILTFKRVIKKKSTEEFSCVPYVMTFLNCLIYTYYGSPMVSHGWDNLPLLTINAIGLVMESCFILLYYWYSTPRSKKTVTRIMAIVLLFSIAVLVVSSIGIPDRGIRRGMVGVLGFFASVAMYGSPLVAVELVIRTKSVEYMPFYLSFFSFLTSSLWMAYGLLNLDVLLASPNFIGVPLGILQLVLYCIYRNRVPEEESYKVDLETGETEHLTAPLISGDSIEKIEKV